MYFSTFDEKEECISAYSDGQIYSEKFPDHLKRTWKCRPSLLSRDPESFDYAYVLCGTDIKTACPDFLEKRFLQVTNRYKAFLKAFLTAKVDLDKYCFFDMVQESFLREFGEVNNMIVKEAFETLPKPPNYNHLKNLHILTTDILSREVKINLDNIPNIELAKRKNKELASKLKTIMRPRIDYNIFGSKTGRLVTNKDTFPVLNMSKEMRKMIEPTNDWLLELDYNAAEIRTMFALLDKTQPDTDIHAHNSLKLGISRDLCKKLSFAFIYGSRSESVSGFQDIFDDRSLKENYFFSGAVHTPFHRKINSDEFHAMNYLLQSTTADLVFEQAYKVFKSLSGHETFLKFILHDSIIIDLKDSEKDLLIELSRAFSDTRFGKFLTNLKVGKNFGNMREIRL